MNNSKNEIKNYIKPEQWENLHEQAFIETFEVLNEFVQQSKLRGNRLAWVCNSAPGAGKTTALKVLCKMVIRNRPRKGFKQFLLVFNNKDTMKEFYEDVLKYSLKMNRDQAIIKIDSENIDLIQGTIYQYQVVCITQQRFRDLSLGYGNFDFFSGINSDKNKPERLIIIDEMPDFINSSVWDIGERNNCVEWFDELTKAANMNIKERGLGRLLISMLIRNQLIEVNCKTEKLINFIKGSDSEKKIMEIMGKLTDLKHVKLDLIKRLDWFRKLLTSDGVGVVTSRGEILCAEWIGYRDMGNILILDGSAHISNEIYSHGGFELKEVKNYHDYSRLNIRSKKINTSNKSRNEDVIEKITYDIKKLREKTKKNILPLPSKGDIKLCVQYGAITQEQNKLFKDRSNTSDNMALNLLNTTGKNDLASYDCLALINLPIRNPQTYRLWGLAMYGNSLDIRLLDDIEREIKMEKRTWFIDERMETVYKQFVLADLYQIIHRSALRKINEKKEVDILIYNKKPEWIYEFQKTFSGSNITEHILFCEDEFRCDCEKRAKVARDWLDINPVINGFTEEPIEYYLGKVGKSFKDWFNKNYVDEKSEDWGSTVSKKQIINEVFKGNDILIRTGKNGYKKISKIINKVT